MNPSGWFKCGYTVLSLSGPFSFEAVKNEHVRECLGVSAPVPDDNREKNPSGERTDYSKTLSNTPGNLPKYLSVVDKLEFQDRADGRV